MAKHGESKMWSKVYREDAEMEMKRTKRNGGKELVKGDGGRENKREIGKE